MQEDLMEPFIIPDEFSIPPPPDHQLKTKSIYIKHVELRGKMVQALKYERLQSSLLAEYLISTHQSDPQVIDRLMTISFKQEHRDLTDYSQEVLKRGVELSGGMFRFLGQSNSQLKEKTCYLMEGTDEEIHDVLAQFADFSKIPSTAKRAKRIGLLFSSFYKSVSLHEGEYEVIQDIQTHQYNFTDGCGFMSDEFAREIKRVQKLDHVPSVVQIRYQGYKGVLVHSPELTGLRVQFRKSMEKYTIPDDEVRMNFSTFGVVECSKPYSKAFLNTQLTMILADNGTPRPYLLELQNQFYRMLTNLCIDEEVALRYLTIIGRTTTIQSLKQRGLNDPKVQQELAGIQNEQIKKMLKDDENNLSSTNRNHPGKKISKLRYLVPKARLVFGVCDPYGELEYGEVFFKPSLPEEEFLEFSNAKSVVVGQNPCYHPGDIRVLKLVHDKQRYIHLHDCVVFPTKGKRPHPDECSGGDLDGDKFFVSWDELLIPEWISNPFPYSEKEEDDPYCSIGETLRSVLSPLVKYFGSFGRAHYQRVFGTEDEAIRQKKIQCRAELLDYFANYNKKIVSRIDGIFMKYASRHGPACETCVTLNKYFTDAIDMTGNSDDVEKQLEVIENNYRMEGIALANNTNKGKKELLFPRQIYPARKIVRRRLEKQEGFLRQLWVECRRPCEKEPFKKGDNVWTTMQELSEQFVGKYR